MSPSTEGNSTCEELRGGGDVETCSEVAEQGSSFCSLVQANQPLTFSECNIPTQSERGFRKFLLLSKSLLIFLVKASASLLPPSSFFFFCNTYTIQAALAPLLKSGRCSVTYVL